MQVCWCTGVFVLVAIGLSTVSVVTSILIIRLSVMSQPLPGWVRLPVFAVIARLMCVRFAAPSKASRRTGGRDATRRQLYCGHSVQGVRRG